MRESLELRVKSSEFRVKSLEFRVQSLEFRVKSSELRGEPSDDTNFGSHAFPALIRISVKQNS